MPPRKPDRLKLLEGTARPDRMHPEVEFPTPVNLTAPDWLLDPEAVREWREKAGLLSAAGVLTVADLSILAEYCNMHAAAVKQWRAGLAPTAADMTQLRLMSQEFGFTPASRSKIGGGSKREPSNAFAKLG